MTQGIHEDMDWLGLGSVVSRMREAAVTPLLLFAPSREALRAVHQCHFRIVDKPAITISLSA